MSGFIDADGSALVGGQLPSSVGQALQLDASGNLKTTSAGSGAGQQNVNLNQVNGAALSNANPAIVRLVDASGNPLLIENNAGRVSLYGKNVAAGDTPVAVNASGFVTALKSAQAVITLAAVSAQNVATSGVTPFYNTGGLSELLIIITMTALAGGAAPTVQFTLQSYDAFGVLQPLVVRAALATATAQDIFSVGAGLEIAKCFGPLIKIAWTTTGGPTTATANIGVQGK